MQLKRVVITGMGVVSPFGAGISALMDGIETGRSAVRYMEGWDQYVGLRSLVGAPAELTDEKKIPRQKRRSMGRIGLFAAQAAEQALTDSGIVLTEESWREGCIVGSTIGSTKSINDAFQIMILEKNISLLNSTAVFQCMSHTASLNVAQYLGLKGYIMATAAACASSMQAIGTGYDLIRLGRQDMLLCGGAEELHPIVTGSFDTLLATSTRYNDTPGKTPRPFDKERDGLVCGEGSGMLVLEEYNRAVERKARIYAEITGFSTTGSGSQISQSDKEAMVRCMKNALSDAGTEPREIDYINAHATATLQGDQEEAEAIGELFGDSVPVSSLKGYIGHTLGASGVIELIASLMMMERGVLYPTRNLETVSAECEGIDHIMKQRKKELNTILKNGFAFGGISTALVCRKT